MIDEILSRLQKVRRTGPDRWLACCPAHEDRSPSLNIKLGTDGTVLIVCRAGCDNEAIREVLGLEWKDFYPEKSTGIYDRKIERAFPAADVLEALAFETTLVTVAACNIANGVVLSVEDKDRLMLAYQRIQAARDMSLGKR